MMPMVFFPVSGMTATALTVSDSTVWALSSQGQVFKRVGVSQNNYIGEAWYHFLVPLTAFVKSIA